MAFRNPFAAIEANPGDASIRILWASALFMCALALPTAAAIYLDDRMIHDLTIWAKPLKFQLSLALHLATLAVLMALVGEAVRGSISLRMISFLSAVMALGEIIYITLQSARGRKSHWNFETAWETFAYGAMGFGAATLVLVAAWLGVILWRHPRDGLKGGLHLGASLGLVLGGVLTLAVAGLMSTGMVQGPQHWVGRGASDADGLPLFGWSMTHGDLRVPHFFAMHLMQALPLLGFLADRTMPGAARLIVWLGAAFGVAVIGGTLAQAIAGRPFLAL